GALPIDELTIVEAGGDKRYSFVKFQVEILTPGDVIFRFDDANGITAWAETNVLAIQERTLTASFTQGVHQVILAVDRDARKDGSSRVQLTDDGGAQARLVMGK